MVLSERERWIHYFSTITTFGMLEHLSKKDMMKLASEIKNERCRSLSKQDMLDIIGELEEEQQAGKIAMDEILQREIKRIESCTDKHDGVGFFTFGGDIK